MMVNRSENNKNIFQNLIQHDQIRKHSRKHHEYYLQRKKKRKEIHFVDIIISTTKQNEERKKEIELSSPDSLQQTKHRL